MPPAPVVEAGHSECFHYSLEVLKVHRLLEVAVPAPVAQPPPVVLARYQDKGTKSREDEDPYFRAWQSDSNR